MSSNSIIINYTFRLPSDIFLSELLETAVSEQLTSVSSRAEAIFERYIKNPFSWALASTTATGGVIAISAALLSPLSAIAISAGSITMLFFTYFAQSEQIKKWLFCEASLMLTAIASSVLPLSAGHSWYSKINDQLTLGANPLQGHVDALKEEGHTAVLSMIEPFETEPHLCGVPMKPEDWKAADVTFLNLPNPDLTPVRLEDVERGVEFVLQQISNGGRVYVHCNAGVGRSATIVICYLMKHQGMSLADAINYVHSKRAIAVGENSPAIQNFVQAHSYA